MKTRDATLSYDVLSHTFTLVLFSIVVDVRVLLLLPIIHLYRNSYCMPMFPELSIHTMD